MGAALAAEPIAPVQADDATRDCAGLASERTRLDAVVAAGDRNSANFGKAAASTAANVGGQIAGGVAAQSIGGVVSKVAGAVAQQAAEEKMGPDDAARQRAAEARPRQGFLNKPAIAWECRKDDPAYVGKPLSADEFARLSAQPERSGELVADLRPFSSASVEPLLAAPMTPLDTPVQLDNQLRLAGKETLAISEFRMLFEVGGEVSARTRAGYMKKPILVPGAFANFREVGGYDSRRDGVAKTMTLPNLSGVAANQSKCVEMEIDPDGPASTRLMLAGLATFNTALARAIKAN